MNDNGRKICNNCFRQIKTEPCKYCGYKKSAYRPEAGILPVGTVLKKRYCIGEVLGKGGFGVTYKAFDTVDSKIVAVKEYYPSGLVHRDTGTTQISVSSKQYEDNFKVGADKFFEEAKMVSRFNGNPNIVNVYEFFYENGTVYFAMEYLDGVDLKHFVKERGGKLPQENVLYIADIITDALLIAHSMNVLHRDISPDNIFILNNGEVKLIDFGAARQVLAEQSKSISVILKQGFAPLEQYQRRGKQGPWTDIYALGATLYYVITGKMPDEVTERLDFPDIGSADEYGVDPEFWEIIRKCMEVRAADRYQTVFELKEKLNALSIKPSPLIWDEVPDKEKDIVDVATQNVIPGTVAVQADMSETVAADGTIPETVAVQNDMPETVAEQSGMPETVAVQNGMPETVAVQNDMPETVAVQNDIPETVAVTDADSSETTESEDVIYDSEEDDKKKGFIGFIGNTRGKIITAAAVIVLIGGTIALAAGLSGRSDKKTGGNKLADAGTSELVTEQSEEQSVINTTEESTEKDTKEVVSDTDDDKQTEEEVTTENTQTKPAATKPAATKPATPAPAPAPATKPATPAPAPATKPAATKPAATKPVTETPYLTITNGSVYYQYYLKTNSKSSVSIQMDGKQISIDSLTYNSADKTYLLDFSKYGIGSHSFNIKCDGVTKLEGTVYIYEPETEAPYMHTSTAGSVVTITTNVPGEVTVTIDGTNVPLSKFTRSGDEYSYDIAKAGYSSGSHECVIKRGSWNLSLGLRV